MAKGNRGRRQSSMSRDVLAQEEHIETPSFVQHGDGTTSLGSPIESELPTDLAEEAVVQAPPVAQPSSRETYVDIITKFQNKEPLTDTDIQNLKSIIDANQSETSFKTWVGKNSSLAPLLKDIIEDGKITDSRTLGQAFHNVDRVLRFGEGDSRKTESIEALKSTFGSIPMPASLVSTVNPAPAAPASEVPDDASKERYIALMDRMKNGEGDLSLSEMDELKKIIDDNQDRPEFENWYPNNTNLATMMYAVIAANKHAPSDFSVFAKKSMEVLDNVEPSASLARQAIKTQYADLDTNIPEKVSRIAGIEASAQKQAAPEATPNASEKTSTENSAPGDSTGTPDQTSPETAAPLTPEQKMLERREALLRESPSGMAMRDAYRQRLEEIEERAKVSKAEADKEAASPKAQGGGGGFFNTLAQGLISRLQSGSRTKEQGQAAIELQTRYASKTAQEARIEIENVLIRTQERREKMERYVMEKREFSERYAAKQHELSVYSTEVMGDPNAIVSELAKANAERREPVFPDAQTQKMAKDFLEEHTRYKDNMNNIVNQSMSDRMNAARDAALFQTKAEYLGRDVLSDDAERELLTRGGQEICDEMGKLQNDAVDNGLTGNPKHEEGIRKKMQEAAEKIREMINQMFQRVSRLMGGPSLS